MKMSRFSDSQVLAILKQAENGVPVTELCREQCKSGHTQKRIPTLGKNSVSADMDASL